MKILFAIWLALLGLGVYLGSTHDLSFSTNHPILYAICFLSFVLLTLVLLGSIKPKT